MYQNGADVVYHAAGGSGGGVFTAAKAAGKLAIGVDSDQALTAPADVRGVILTSMIKKVDVAVMSFITDATKGQFAGPQGLRPQGRRCRLQHHRWSGRRHQDQAGHVQAADHRRQDHGSHQAVTVTG